MRMKFIWMPILFVAICIAMTAVVMLLWNWLMPVVFGLGLITFWQALGLLVMCKILFGGFKGKHHCGCSSHQGYGQNGWKEKFKSKWQHMSEEDRKKWEEKFCMTKGQKSTAKQENDQA